MLPTPLNWNNIPPSIDQAFGDIRRYEDALRELGAGKIVNDNYAPEPLRDGWQKPFRDENGLYLPAKIAAQAITTEAALLALESTGDNRHTRVQHIQLPMDDIDEFVVYANPYDINENAQYETLTSYTNTPEVFRRFMQRNNLVFGRYDPARQRHDPDQLSGRVKHDVFSDPKQPRTSSIAPEHSLHIDKPRSAVTLAVLASDRKQTLEYVGRGVIGASRAEIDDSIVFTGRTHFDGCERHLREVPQKRVILMTGMCLHTRSYGDTARRYINPTTGRGRRVFARFEADIIG